MDVCRYGRDEWTLTINAKSSTHCVTELIVFIPYCWIRCWKNFVWILYEDNIDEFNDCELLRRIVGVGKRRFVGDLAGETLTITGNDEL